MIARIELPAKLVETAAVVMLPHCTLDEAIAPVEVLIQEGLSVVSLAPGSRVTPSALRRVFGRRLLIGAHDLRTAEHASWAIAEDAAFVLTLGDDEQLSRALAEAAIPQCPNALTPTEVAGVWKKGETSAVQVVPAAVLGPGYPAQLRALVPGAALVARGADSLHEIEAWLSAGASAVCLGDRLIADAFRRGNLSGLRSRSRPIVEIVNATRSSSTSS